MEHAKERIFFCYGHIGEVFTLQELSIWNGQDSFSFYFFYHPPLSYMTVHFGPSNLINGLRQVWKIKKDVIEDEQNGALILKVPGQNIILHKLRKVFIGLLYPISDWPKMDQLKPCKLSFARFRSSFGLSQIPNSVPQGTRWFWRRRYRNRWFRFRKYFLRWRSRQRAWKAHFRLEAGIQGWGFTNYRVQAEIWHWVNHRGR